VNRIAFRAPRAAGIYTVRLAFPSVSVTAPMRVGSVK
jgi:hypothetical protein